MSLKDTKILITQDYSPLDGKGVSVVSFGFAKELVKLGASVVCASYNPQTVNSNVGGVAIKKLVGASDLGDEVDIADIVIPIISFSYIFKPFGLSVMQLCSELNKAYIPWVHTTLQNSKFSPAFGIDDYVQGTAIKLITKALNDKMCAVVIGVSRATAESVLSLGVPPEKIKVVLNGVDTSEKEPETGNNPEKTNDIICVQRLSPEKGNDLTLAVLANIKAKIPDLKAAIVGTGAELGKVKALVDVYGLKNNVTVVSSLENGNLKNAIKKSKVFLSTSLTESFGLAIAESMLVGTPVIVPDLEGPKELVGSSECGYTYTVSDTLTPANLAVKILTGEIDTSETVNKAKEKIMRDCDVVVQAGKFAALISEVLPSPAPRV